MLDETLINAIYYVFMNPTLLKYMFTGLILLSTLISILTITKKWGEYY